MIDKEKVSLPSRFREVLARGYCSKDNSGKQIDIVLINAMVLELEKIGLCEPMGEEEIDEKD